MRQSAKRRSRSNNIYNNGTNFNIAEGATIETNNTNRTTAVVQLIRMEPSFRGRIGLRAQALAEKRSGADVRRRSAPSNP
jgi:hypothetical protein